MRRKPQSQNNGGYSNNNQHRRHHRSGGGGHGQNHHNRPRKNYPALREKYLQQARDALSAGDRVLAENYFQHAEHCYRMMVEEGYNFRQAQPTVAAGEDAAPAAPEAAEEAATIAPHGLPSFITQPHAGHESLDQAMAKEPVIVQNWEEN